MSIHIQEVDTIRDLKTFIRFPLSLYKGSPYYVPLLNADELNTLRRDKNPAFEYCQARYWLAYRDGKAVGRVAAIHNRLHIQKWQQPILRFGWIDFVDDYDVSAALMAAVEGWARELGLPALHGPLGFTDMDREGMLIEGFEELGTLATIYNYPYYPRHLERLGYQKDTDWLEYEISLPEELPPSISKLSEILIRRYQLSILEPRSKKELLNYAGELFQLLNEAYEHLYGVTPLTPRQVQAYIRQYFDYISPDFVPIILDANGRMVAFGICLPSLSRALQKAAGSLFPFGFIHLVRALTHNDRADLYLIGVKDEYRGRGLNAILIERMYHIFRRRGIRKVESNPELETNLNVQTQWKLFDTRQHKRRRCYIKQLG